MTAVSSFVGVAADGAGAGLAAVSAVRSTIGAVLVGPAAVEAAGAAGAAAALAATAGTAACETRLVVVFETVRVVAATGLAAVRTVRVVLVDRAGEAAVLS